MRWNLSLSTSSIEYLLQELVSLPEKPGNTETIRKRYTFIWWQENSDRCIESLQWCVEEDCIAYWLYEYTELIYGTLMLGGDFLFEWNKTLCMGSICYSCSLCAGVLSHFNCVQLLGTLWTIAHQAPLSMGFSRQERWSGLPCPSPRDLPHPGIKPRSLMSPALADRFFTTRATWEAPFLALY